jgi:methyl-accepting chemotaxis protein
MKSMKLSARLALGFSLLLVLLAAMAALGIHRMTQIQAQLDQIVKVNNLQAKLAVAMRVAVNRVAISTRNLVLLTDEGDLRAEAEKMKQARADYDAAQRRLGELFADRTLSTDEEREHFARVGTLLAEARDSIDQVVALGMKNENEEATRVLVKTAQPRQEAVMKALSDLTDLEDRLNEKAGDDARSDYENARRLMVLLALLAVALGSGSAWLLTRSVLRQLGADPADAVDVVHRIARGDLARPVPVREGDTSSLLAAMHEMQQALAGVVEGIRNGADGIATGSGQIAAGNADLSQRTEEQASNLQQTAASMEQLTGTVQHNADNARQASQLALGASSAAARGGQVVGEVVRTMDDISASSRKIAEIIGVIDGIAFQTNILALNAAVEAARAGEQGRGFAVVAGEVRALAQRSAEAAREIKGLIGASVEKVEAGTGLVAQAGHTMTDLVDQVKRVSDLINEISAASVEQTSGIGQINDAVTQLDQVTQQNAALVEESAAAAESLRSQAARLVEAVSAFRTTAA